MAATTIPFRQLSGVQPLESQSALTYAATITLDFNQADSVRTIALTGNLTFNAASNKAAAKSKTVIITADASTRTLSFPASWVWMDQVAPSSIAAGKRAFLYLYCQGTAESDISAFYSVQP